MTGQKDDRGNQQDRARDTDEHRAHSGAESQPQQRSVPGTASAEEGYQPGRGTSAGNPLEGIEVERSAAEPEDEDRV